MPYNDLSEVGSSPDHHGGTRSSHVQQVERNAEERGSTLWHRLLSGPVLFIVVLVIMIRLFGAIIGSILSMVVTVFYQWCKTVASSGSTESDAIRRGHVDGESKSSSVVKSEVVVVGDCPTLVLKLGKVTTDTKQLVLIIPGNPGIAEYYRDFMCSLYKESGGKVPVWCVSHAGHDSQTPSPTCKFNPKSLSGQILHKGFFVRDHLPSPPLYPSLRVILIGHSIGCYMIVDLLRDADTRKRIHNAVLLFPTIERMAESPSGRKVTPVLKYGGRWLAPLLACPFYYLLPENILKSIVQRYLSNTRGAASPCSVTATLHLANPSVVSHVVCLAYNEMMTVRAADHETLRNNIDRLFFYYGATDHWTPKEYYDGMKERYPRADIMLCERGIAHAFVLGSSDIMARVVWSWINGRGMTS